MIINNLDEYHLARAESKRLRRRMKRLFADPAFRSRFAEKEQAQINTLHSADMDILFAEVTWEDDWEKRYLMRKQWAKPLENLIRRLKELCDEQTKREAEEKRRATKANS